MREKCYVEPDLAQSGDGGFEVGELVGIGGAESGGGHWRGRF